MNNLILLCLGVLAFMAFHFREEKVEPSVQITQEELMNEDSSVSQSTEEFSLQLEYAQRTNERSPSSVVW